MLARLLALAPLLAACRDAPMFELDYDAMHMLDAEHLGEGGVASQYEELLPTLREYVDVPEAVTETHDSDTGRYVVHFRGEDFVIHEPDFDGQESWKRGTLALFRIVNDQLAPDGVRFYAVNGGNELGGFFLTPEQCEAARAGLEDRRDWPYLPVEGDEWLGQPH